MSNIKHHFHAAQEELDAAEKRMSEALDALQDAAQNMSRCEKEYQDPEDSCEGCERVDYEAVEELQDAVKAFYRLEAMTLRANGLIGEALPLIKDASELEYACEALERRVALCV